MPKEGFAKPLGVY
jgi:choline dehydrogenase-like flavoprotein